MWNTFLIDGGLTPANFAARITAVTPEPSTLVLASFGSLVLLGYLSLKRRSFQEPKQFSRYEN